MDDSVTATAALVNSATPDTAIAGRDQLTGKSPPVLQSVPDGAELQAFIDELQAQRGGRALKLRERAGLVADFAPAALARQWMLMFAWADTRDGSHGSLESLKQGWKAGVKEYLEFALKYESSGFIGTPAKAAQLVEIPPYIGGYVRPSAAAAPLVPRKYPPLAALVANVLETLWSISAGDQQAEKIFFQAQNYAGHGGDKWSGKGYSVDLYPCKDVGLTKRYDTLDGGFWPPAIVTELISRLAQAVAAAKASWWHVLYNDTRVIQAINDKFGRVAAAHKGEFKLNDQGKVKANWHGPAHVGFIHVHVDMHP